MTTNDVNKLVVQLKLRQGTICKSVHIMCTHLLTCAKFCMYCMQKFKNLLLAQTSANLGRNNPVKMTQGQKPRLFQTIGAFKVNSMVWSWKLSPAPDILGLTSQVT